MNLRPHGPQPCALAKLSHTPYEWNDIIMWIEKQLFFSKIWKILAHYFLVLSYLSTFYKFKNTSFFFHIPSSGILGTAVRFFCICLQQDIFPPEIILFCGIFGTAARFFYICPIFPGTLGTADVFFCICPQQGIFLPEFPPFPEVFGTAATFFCICLRFPGAFGKRKPQQTPGLLFQLFGGHFQKWLTPEISRNWAINVRKKERRKSYVRLAAGVWRQSRKNFHHFSPVPNVQMIKANL